MEKKILKKFILMLLLLVLLFSSLIKIHSLLTEPKISDWNYHQLQKIDKSKTVFSFAVFGDNKNSVEIFQSLIHKLDNDNLLFVIDDGDLAYDGETEKIKFFLKQIRKLKKPLLTVFGNHDAREKGRAVYYEFFGPFYYSFNVGNSYFIVLDDSNEKGLDDEQFEWLKKELKISQRYKNRFVFMHVPLYDPRKGNYGKGHSLKDLDFARKLNDLFDRNNVTLLFCSHIHGFFNGTWGKTPYIITGGGGAELAGQDPKHYFYHYVRVHIDSNSVSYEVVKVRKPHFELIDRWIHDTWIYVYSFASNCFVEILFVVILLCFGIFCVL